MKTRLELNKKFLDKNLEGRINLEGLARLAYLSKGEEGRPELVLVYETMPGWRERNKIASISEDLSQHVNERRYRFANLDVIMTTIAADDKYVRENQKHLDQNEAFSMYCD
jgi:hypothetical protein